VETASNGRPVDMPAEELTDDRHSSDDLARMADYLRVRRPAGRARDAGGDSRVIRGTTLVEMNLATSEVAAAERRLLDVMQVEPDGPARWTRPAALAHRPTRLGREPANRFPQNVFLVETGGATFVGRKLMSSFSAAGRLPEPHCSRIVASHLLGRLRSLHTDEGGLSLYYHPLRDAEKRGLLAR